jgi:hypothetical protein
MKLNIKRIGIIFFIFIAFTGCIKYDTKVTPINSYVTEKSLLNRHNSNNTKIINETSKLSMPYLCSLNMLLLPNETISSSIPLGDRGIMSEHYYLNTYIEDQDLVRLMFEKRESFARFHVEYSRKSNSDLNNKLYDYVMYFDISTIGEFDIYLKEINTDTIFPIWNADKTDVNPIQEVENILKSRYVKYTCPETNATKETNTTKETNATQNTNTSNAISDVSVKTKNIKDVNSCNIVKKSISKAKKTTSKTIKTTTSKTRKSTSKPMKTTSKTKKTKKANFYRSKRDSKGCYAYNILNQCVMW